MSSRDKWRDKRASRITERVLREVEESGEIGEECANNLDMH